jgi:decaprenylphospho-beta-D-ribofuranose 2-oxidase
MATTKKNLSPLVTGRLKPVENFGHSIAQPGYVFRPTKKSEIAKLFVQAKKHGFTIGLRGSGKSYGDASLNSGQAIVDFRRMSRILEWDAEKGTITVEPGVTIEDLWRYTLEDAWWPAVMPGTMKPTLGGALAANVHGKNNWKVGPIGEHVLSFTALLPNGEEKVCTPTKNKDLFYAMIGGMGLLGVFTSITFQLKKIYSGNLQVSAWAEPNLERILSATDEFKENDYTVGWVDTTVGGNSLGRGQMHVGRYLTQEEDTSPHVSLNPEMQDLPDNIMGLVPKSMVWKFMKYFINNPGAKMGNWAKYMASRTLSHHKKYIQSLVGFTFLLDYVPNWERSYGDSGLIQYQSFLPKKTALAGFTEVLKTSQADKLPAYLGVVKRHRPDKFLLSHAVDGFSLALDIKVPPKKAQKLIGLSKRLNQIILDNNGKFYFAKDSTLTKTVVEKSLGKEAVEKLHQLKKKTDPDQLLQSNLYKRCFL